MILNSQCVSSTVIMLNKTIKVLRCWRENPASVALRKVVQYPKQWETSLTCQSLRQRSKTAAEKIARSNTRNTKIQKTETRKTLMNNRRRLLRRRKAIRGKSKRKSPSCVCFYDQSNTVKITSRKCDSLLFLACLERQSCKHRKHRKSRLYIND